MKTEPDEYRLLIGFGAALTSYLGLGLALWAVKPGVLFQVTYVLFIFVVFLTVRLRRIERKLIAVRREAAATISEMEDLKALDGLARGMLGLALYLKEPPRSDTRHHLNFVKEEYIISHDDGLYVWTLDGYNVTENPSNHLYVKMSGDSAIDAAAIPIRVVDELDGDRELEVQCINDTPNCKSYSIAFGAPLLQGDRFRIRLNCRWDNTFPRTRSHDYVFSAWGAFASQGVDRWVGRLVSDVPISDVLLERLENTQQLREPRQPLIEESVRQWTVDWEVRNPSSIYLLSFRKNVQR